MNKLELVKALKDKTGLTRVDSGAVVDLFFSEIAHTLANNGRVEIRGLCSMFVKEYEPHKGRNPKTGKEVLVAGKKLPFFKCGKELKERVTTRPRYWFFT